MLDTKGANGGPVVEIDNQYDSSGHLVGLTGAPADTRTFVVDADGRVLQKTQAGHVEGQWIVSERRCRLDRAE